MASRTASRALRSSIQQLAKPAVQRRSFVAAASAVRAGANAAPKAAMSAGVQQQKRGMKTIDFAGVKETVYGMRALSVETRGYTGRVLTRCLQSVRTGQGRNFL
jgi:hypothetical protein